MRDTAERFMSLQEVGDELGVSNQTVRRWVKAGELAAYKPGKEYRVKGSDLEEFLETREVGPKGPRPLSAEWALKVPPDTFEREVQAAETDPLRRLVAELAGDLSKQTLEAWKRDTSKDAQRARARRGIALSLAYIVRNELVARGERPPEKGLPELQRWIDATDG